MKCLQCYNFKEESELIKLKCDHLFCWICVNEYLKANLKPKIKCPISNCNEYIRDSQIRKVLSDEDIVKYENMCISGIRKSHKCLLKECSASVMYTNPNVQYSCPSCTLYNCISCRAAHMFSTCKEFKEMNPLERQNLCQAEIDRATQIYLDNKGHFMRDLLISLEDNDLLTNDKVFECSICTMVISKGSGVKLRNCSHNLCWSCLSQHIKEITKIPVKCPESECENIVTDREIQSVLSPEELKQYFLKCNDFSKEKIKNRLHCQTPNCQSFYDCSVIPDQFTCQNCQKINCVKCNTVHVKETCEEYQNKLKFDESLKVIKERIKKRELMRCPGCSTLLEKTGGCNWIQCSKCSLELCWILQMRRWGPKGRGDTSGGCKCQVNGVYCHPDCLGCIPDNRRLNTIAEDSDSNLDGPFFRYRYRRNWLDLREEENRDANRNPNVSNNFGRRINRRLLYNQDNFITPIIPVRNNPTINQEREDLSTQEFPPRVQQNQDGGCCIS